MRKGHVQLGLIAREPDCALILYRLSEPRRPSKSAIPWSDAPFTQHVVPPERRATALAERDLTPASRQLV